MTNRAVAVSFRAAIIVATLSSATPVGALDVRLGDSDTVYTASFARAYVPCVTPNDVARNGIAACSPAVTSACTIGLNGTIVVTQAPSIVPFGELHYLPINEGPKVCDETRYIDFVTRVSGDFFDPDTIPCPSGHCTFQDYAYHQRVDHFINLVELPPLIPPRQVSPWEWNYEILGMTMTGSDGLPLAALGLDPGRQATVVSSNMTVPYAPCTQEYGSACDLVPWTAACDYEWGTITWEQADTLSAPSVHVLLRDVAGATELCKTGTYHLETTVRPTVLGCGDVANAPQLCTLVDQSFSLPLVANGRNLDATAELPLGDLGDFGRFTGTEIVSARLIDPTGQALAVPGTAGITRLVKPQLLMNGDAIRLKTTIVLVPDAVLDPTYRFGLTVTITDPNGPVYSANIPAPLWQLQTPIGSGWTYEDPGGAIGGIRKVRLKRLGRAGADKGYKLDFRAEGVDLSAADLPSATIVLSVGDGFSEIPTILRGNRTCVVRGPKRVCK